MRRPSAENGQPAMEVYAVGVLRMLRTSWRALTVRSDLLAGKRWGIVEREVRKEWRYLAFQIKAGNWRAVRNSFNGFLAEHHHEGHNAGRGWTKRAAVRRAAELCAQAVTLPGQEPTP